MDHQLISSTYRLDRKVPVGYLLLLLGAMAILTAVLGLFVEPIVRLTIQDPVYQAITTQIVGSVFIFFIPPWIVEYYYRRRNETYLYRLKREDTSRRAALWMPVLYLLSVPLVGFLAHIMEILPAPLWLKDYLEASEQMIGDLLDVMTGDKRPLSVILVLLSFAVLTPIVEEIFFRGALQGWALSRAKNEHVVVWIVALVFSLAHFEWTGLLARWALGVILGYAALYGGLKASILFHMLNNLVAVLSMYLMGSELDFSPRNTGELLLFSLTSALCIIGITLIVKSMRYTLRRKEILKNIDKTYENE